VTAAIYVADKMGQATQSPCLTAGAA